MSVYNGESKLVESIESILSQTYTDFECIIVDDRSTDGTAGILADYAQKDTRVKIITNEINLGLTKSLNKAIKTATGVYIARMDAEDTSEPTRFAKQVAFLETHPEHGLVGSWVYLIDESSHKIGAMKYPTEHGVLKKFLIKHNPFVHSSIMMRRSVLDTAGLYDETWKYAQDYELFLRLSKYTKIANIGEHLASYRMSPQSITRQKNKEQVMFAIRARSKAIREGQYSIWAYRFLLKPFIGYLLPYEFKQMIKKMK